MAKNIQSVIKGYSRQKEEEQTRLVAAENKLPYINLVNYPFTGDVLGFIPEKLAIKYSVVAFQRLGNVVRVATPFPFAPGLDTFMNGLGDANKIRFEPHFCSETSIDFALKQYAKLVKPESKKNQAQAEEESIDQFLKNVADLKDFGGAIQNVSTTKLFETILSGAIAFNASDIHFEPQANFIRVRFRVDGELRDVAEITAESYHLLNSRVKNLSGLKLNKNAGPQDGRFSIEIGQGKMDVRVSVLPATYGEVVELRLLSGKGFLSLDELGLDEATAAAIARAIKFETGMIIVTGPTGAGKTTTLYAILRLLNTPDKKIITIEDPVEYKIAGIEQIQVQPDRGFDFAQALRAVLRQDPNIILVGEIRDKETAEIAINASLTGHLVLTTLHANSAPATFARLIEMGAPPHLLADAIRLIISQRLVKRPDPKAGEPGRMVQAEYLEPTAEYGELIKQKGSIREFEELFKKLSNKNQPTT